MYYIIHIFCIQYSPNQDDNNACGRKYNIVFTTTIICFKRKIETQNKSRLEL